MTDPLEQRVTATLHARAAQAHVSPDAYNRIVERGTRATARARRLRFAAVTAVAAVVAVAVAVPLVLDGRRVDEPDVRLTQPPVEEPSTEAAPAPAPGVWSRAADDSALAAGEGDSYTSDVTVFDGRVIAAGLFWPDRDHTQGTRAAVWISEDGPRWTLAGDAEAGLGHGSVDALAAGGGVVVALGEVDDGRQPTAWRSVDGVNWEEVAIPGTGLPAELVWTGERFVATAGGEPDEVWTSTDGLQWEVRTLELPIEPNFTEGMLSPLTLVGDRIILFGAERVAVSDDGGLSWAQRTLAEAGLADAGLTTHDEVVLLPDGTLLAVAPTERESEGNPQSLASESVYASPDGLSWESRGRFGSDLSVIDLTVTADGTIVAAGVAGTPGSATIWTSADGGRTWTEDPDGVFGPGTALSAVTATDNGLVAVGEIEEAGAIRGAAWVTSPAPAPPPPPTTAPAPPSLAWTRANDDAAFQATDGNSFVYDVAASGGGAVAVGASESPAPDGGDPVSAATIWLSQDGQRWSTVLQDASGWASGVASGGNVVVAVGNHDERPAAWWSGDGQSWELVSLQPGAGDAHDVAWTGERFVAVGFDDSEGTEGGFGSEAVWTSVDGRRWERAPLEDFSGDTPLTHVAAAGDRVVALGQYSVAVSADAGLTWTARPQSAIDLPNPDDGIITTIMTALGFRDGDDGSRIVTAITGLADGTFLASYDQDRSVYATADGLAWEIVGQFPAPTGDTFRQGSLAVLDDGTVMAVGPVVLTSRDGGRTWTGTDSANGGFGLVTVTETGLVVAVGGVGDEDPVHPAVWVARL